MVNDKKTILLADSDPATARAESRILKSAGYSVIVPKSGLNAPIKAASLKKADLILMDAGSFSTGDGKQAAESILSGAGIPVVYLAGAGETDIIEKTGGISPCGYVLKNSAEPLLLAVIKTALDLHETSRKHKEREEALVAELEERKKSEGAIRESEERFKALIQNLGDFVVILNNEGVILYENPVTLVKLGHSVVGKNAFEIIHPEDIGVVAEGFMRVQRNANLNIPTPFRVKHKDGSWIYVESLSANLTDNPNVGGIMSICRDITIRTMVEQALRESEQKFRTVYNAIPDLAWLKDTEGRYIAVNQAFARAAGMPDPQMAAGKTDMDIWPANLAEGYMIADREVLESKKEKRIEQTRQNKSGTKFVETIKRPFIDDRGNIIGTVGISRDITDRKKAEEKIQRQNEELEASNEELQETIEELQATNEEFEAVNEELIRSQEELLNTQKMLQLVLDSIPVRVFWKDRDLNYMGCNRLFALDAGLCSPMDIIGKNDFELGWSKQAERYRIDDRNVIDTLQPKLHYEEPQSTPEGAFIWLRTSKVPLQDINGRIQGVLGTYEDITGRKEAEENLQISNARLRTVLNEIIQSMASIIEIKDPYTAGHQRRVADLARAIAARMKLPEEQVDGIHYAASMHDIGKIQVPAELLSKPTRLMNLEFEIIKTHPQIGYDILKNIDFPWPIAEIVYLHHERCNGSGYPRGLKNRDIMIEARILAVADVVEAITSHRPYRPALGGEIAMEEIKHNRGILYDADVVDACVDLFTAGGFIFN